MNTFTSFDGIRIAYHDEGAGPAVILLHGFGVDGLGQSLCIEGHSSSSRRGWKTILQRPCFMSSAGATLAQHLSTCKLNLELCR